MEQDILIYVDDKERLDASVAANSFAHKNVKNRAYINTLGAELAMKYLVSENIDVSTARNIHSIKKILEETDIADIMLPNIHIDVRVVFDKNAIFIPKSHFEYDIAPDIYLVFNLSQDREFVKFLGFFEPKLINKNNANSDYYFIEKEKLSPALDLINYINSHIGSTNSELSDEEFETSESLIISMSDNDISEADKKYLIKQLTKSAELRDKFIEYENFETLSYKAMNDPMIEKKEVPVTEEVDLTTEPLDIEENIIEEEIPTEEPVLDEIDFEALEVPETVETFEEPALDGISLDAVELPIEEDTAEEPLIDETISLDAIELPTEETIIEEPVADMLSFDDVEPLQTEEVPTETPVEDILSFDGIEPLQEELSPVEETPMMAFEELAETADTTQEDVMPFEESALEIPDIIEPTVDTPPVIDDIIDSLPFESEEEPVQSEDSSFGKNLLENLAEENIDNVEIENYNHDDISSQDLLSQIDDVLSTSSTVSDDVIPADSIDDILNDAGDLNVLYNEETTAEEQPSIPEPEEEAEPQIPGAALYNNKKSADKKSLITAGALIAVLAGMSAFYFLKPKDTTADIEPLPVNRQASEVAQNTPDDLLASNTPTPQAPVKKDIETSKPVVQELKNNPPKPVKSESYLEVNRLVWDVPDALSYSPKMQSYLRTAGRSIKLSLSADLLLATEYAYTNQVKVGLKLSKNGSVQDARILSGSGSTQIDNIVLQSVKDTLNVVKPPSDEIKTPDFNLNLIIYF